MSQDRCVSCRAPLFAVQDRETRMCLSCRSKGNRTTKRGAVSAQAGISDRIPEVTLDKDESNPSFEGNGGGTPETEVTLDENASNLNNPYLSLGTKVRAKEVPAIKEKARKRGLTMSEFIRELLIEAE